MKIRKGALIVPVGKRAHENGSLLLWWSLFKTRWRAAREMGGWPRLNGYQTSIEATVQINGKPVKLSDRDLVARRYEFFGIVREHGQ